MVCTMGPWDRGGRISGTNIGKGSILGVRIEIGIASTRAHVACCEGNGGG